MKKYQIITIAALLLVPGIFTGCSHKLGEPTLLEANWGRSHDAAKYNQLLNPDASTNLTPVSSMDGQADENALEKYRNSFKEEQTEEVYNLNIGVGKQ